MCIAITKKGTKCTRKATNGNERCTMHHKQFLKEQELKQACVTITFGDVAENHAGMQKIGEMVQEGFSIKELEDARKVFEDNGYVCETFALHDRLNQVPEIIELQEATVLVVRGFCEGFGEDFTSQLLSEQLGLEWDKKAKMKGRVVNKRARYNLCYSEKAQKPDYKNGQGTIIPYSSVPLLSSIRESLPKFLSEKAKNLNAEGNYYYDISKCGIGWHGDAERKIVIAIRLGYAMSLSYQWYKDSRPVGVRMDIDLNPGDLYVMSQKATGFDWRKKKKFATLRHAAGCDKYLAISRTKEIRFF